MDQGKCEMARQRDNELPDPKGIHLCSGTEQRKSRNGRHRDCKRSCNLSILSGIITSLSTLLNFKSLSRPPTIGHTVF